MAKSLDYLKAIAYQDLAFAATKGGFISDMLGSPSKAYRQANWHVVRDGNIAGSVHWQHFAGNPKAGSLPRKWPDALLLNADPSALLEYVNARRGHPAVAIPIGSVMLAAVIPEGLQSLGRLVKWQAEHPEEKFTVAMRRGRGEFKGTMGVLYGGGLNKWQSLPKGIFSIDPTPVEVAQIADSHSDVVLI